MTAGYVFDLPWFKEQRGFTGHALGGWEVFGLVYYYTGSPLTVTVTTSFISASFGKVTTANDPRIMQLGVKFCF